MRKDVRVGLFGVADPARAGGREYWFRWGDG